MKPGKRKWSRHLFAPSLLALSLAAGWVRANTQAVAPVDPALFKALHWRGIGPYRGGRSDAVTGVSGEAGLFYFGAAAGGVWKTIDSGATWKPIFDDQANLSIGAVTVAPSDHNIVYVGTGEGALRGDITWGPCDVGLRE